MRKSYRRISRARPRVRSLTDARPSVRPSLALCYGAAIPSRPSPRPRPTVRSANYKNHYSVASEAESAPAGRPCADPHFEASPSCVVNFTYDVQSAVIYHDSLKEGSSGRPVL